MRGLEEYDEVWVDALEKREEQMGGLLIQEMMGQVLSQSLLMCFSGRVNETLAKGAEGSHPWKNHQEKDGPLTVMETVKVSVIWGMEEVKSWLTLGW